MSNVLINEIKEVEDLTLRPKLLKEYIGQDSLKNNLKVFIEAAKNRNEVLDHLLFYGPPGLGKTTLAHIIANEMNSKIQIINGASIERTGDLASILSSIEPGEILFIDEIHRLPKFVEEILYSAMEDFKLITTTGFNDTTSSIDINLPPFTLIGATTKSSGLTSPLRDRFGIQVKLNYYSIEELILIVIRTSEVFKIRINKESAKLIAMRSRGTPRIAIRLFKRIRDFANFYNTGEISYDLTLKALKALKVDSLGLDDLDIEILKCLIMRYKGGPVSLESIASTIGEETSNLEEMYEPYLLQVGLINRTSRGRIATELAYKHLNISKN